MKSKLSIGVCVIISLALVAFGLLYGTMRGYEDERQQVIALLEGENGLMDALSYRGADGLNLCVVAERHLKGDPDVAALRTASESLRGQQVDLAHKKQADDALDAAVQAVAAKLRDTPSFQQSERDMRYLTMLTTDMQNLTKSLNADTYNTAAREYNMMFSRPVLGVLASLAGARQCALFE